MINRDAPDPTADKVYMHIIGTSFTTALAWMSYGGLGISDTVFCFYVVASLTWGGVAALTCADWLREDGKCKCRNVTSGPHGYRCDDCRNDYATLTDFAKQHNLNT